MTSAVSIIPNDERQRWLHWLTGLIRMNMTTARKIVKKYPSTQDLANTYKCMTEKEAKTFFCKEFDLNTGTSSLIFLFIKYRHKTHVKKTTKYTKPNQDSL